MMTAKQQRIKKTLLITLCLPLLSACGAETLTFKAVTLGLTASANGIFSNPEVNLREKNYAAADYMEQQMRVNVKRSNVIFAKPLEEHDNPGISSALGENIAEGVSLRLIELGYNVYLHDVIRNNQTNPYPLPPAGQSPDYMLKGTYDRKKDHVLIKLRLIDIKSGRITASFEYPLLLSPEVRTISQTETRIYKIP
jgi:FlgO protein